MKNIPKLRFKGFSGEWEEKKLESLGDFQGGGTPTTLKEKYWIGNIPWISSSDIVDEDIRNINVSKFINKVSIEQSATKIIPKDSILFVSRVGVGKLAIAHTDLCTSQDFTNLTLKNDYSYFVGYYFVSKNSVLDKYSQGTSIKGFTSSDLKTIKLSLPQKTEQTKIGDYFQHLDKLIEQKEKKYQKLRQFKKASLDKMFPKNGANTPEIRFKGFSGEWEEKKFGELAEVRRGLTYKPTDVNDNGVKVLRSSNILDDTFVNNKDDVYVNEEAINIKYVSEHDILITSANGSSRLVGKHAIIQNLRAETVHGGFMLLVSSKNPFFLNSSMSSSWYNKFINKYVSGGNGAIGNLSKNNLEEQYIYAPETNEQIKIGNYFQQLDKLIKLHLQELTKLKNIKKASLEKMFV